MCDGKAGARGLGGRRNLADSLTVGLLFLGILGPFLKHIMQTRKLIKSEAFVTLVLFG